MTSRTGDKTHPQGRSPGVLRQFIFDIKGGKHHLLETVAG